MLDLDDARALLRDRISPLPASQQPLAKALGLRLAESVASDLDLPPFDASAMDGYALRHADLMRGEALPVAFEIAAGTPPDTLPEGQAARIFTGAVVPAGADTVVMQEEAAVLDDGRVQLNATPVGSHVRHAGELCRAGMPLLEPGTALTPGRIGLLAAAGAARVQVIPRPRIAVVVTGAELVAVDRRPEPGQIRDSNRPLLAALATEANCELSSSGRVADDLVAQCQVLERALDSAELVLSSGGVSVGDYDLVPRAIAELGGEILLHRVRVKPGKPVLVARVGERWIVGLPGNPVSVATSFRLFARPLIEALAGDATAFEEVPLQVRLGEATANRGRRTLMLTAQLEVDAEGLRVTPLAWQGSHDLVQGAAANALIRLEPGEEHAAGARVPCLPLPWRWPGADLPAI